MAKQLGNESLPCVDHLKGIGQGSGLLKDFLLHVVLKRSQIKLGCLDVARDNFSTNMLSMPINKSMSTRPDLNHIAFFEIRQMASRLNQR